MSDNLPLELQGEIMKRLPVKPLIQFRSVCKSWKSLISSSCFIADYSSRQQHLLVKYEEDEDSDVFKQKYVSIVDDHTFPQQKVCVTIPPLLKQLIDPTIVGSSHGLLCLYNDDPDAVNMAVLWNPSIRKAVGVCVPNVVNTETYTTDLGFGVCRETNDPKIVKVIHSFRGNDIESISCMPWQVEVFTLSTGAWRSPYSSNLPCISSVSFFGQVVIDGFLFWLASDLTSKCNRIISFDITSEEFKEVNLPDSLARLRSNSRMEISKLRNSIVLIESHVGEMIYDVWMMEDGVSKSFTNLFTICPPDVAVLIVLEFRKSGELVIEVEHFDDELDHLSLAVYEPDSKHINHLGINSYFQVKAYMETLLLLDQPNLFIYGNTTTAFEV